MHSEITLKAQKQIDGALAEIRRIDEAKAEVMSKNNAAGIRLESLKVELPELLAARALGQATDGEVSALKRDIKDLETSIEDAALAMKGLEAMEQPVRNSLREPRRLLSKVNEYQRVRDDLAAGGLSGVGMLRAMAGLLGFEEDTESFLAGLSHLRT